MYHHIHIKNTVQLSRLHAIFRFPGVLYLPREVHIGGKSANPRDKAPSLALALSSLGHRFWQPAGAIGWSECHVGIRISHTGEPHGALQANILFIISGNA